MAESTVPQGTPPRNDSANTPQQISSSFAPIPGKPSAKTGPGGPSISIPKVGKSGR